MKKIILVMAILGPLSIWGQKDAAFSVHLSSDTGGLNGSIEVTFTLENAPNKQFTPPDFEGFNVQGPSTSMMTSINNGEMKQTVSYTFYLSPRAVGSFKIGSVSLDTEGSLLLKTEEKTVVVLAHYDVETRSQQRTRGLFDSNDDFFFRRPTPPQVPEKPKKKYQTEKL